MRTPPYTLELSLDGAMAYNDDLRIVAAGVDGHQAVAHFADSLVVMLEYLAPGSPERPICEEALAWFRARGPLPVCADCAVTTG